MKHLAKGFKYTFGTLIFIMYLFVFSIVCIISIFGFKKLQKWCLKEMAFLDSIMDGKNEK